MVGLRDRPAADRQVRRRAGGRGRNAPAPRVHRRRRLPYPQPESGPGHERLDAGRLQSRLEARRRPAPAQRAASPAQLLGGTAGGGEGADRLRPRMGRDPRSAKGDRTTRARTQPKPRNYFVRHGRYTAGTATHYRPSLLTAEPDHQHLAKGLRSARAFTPHRSFGSRTPSRFILATSPRRTGASGFLCLPAQAISRLRTPLFARCATSCARVPSLRSEGTRRADADIDSVIDVRAVFQQAHPELAIEAMPPLLLPPKGRYGLRDYEKMFCPDLKGGHDIFAMRGIDREKAAWSWCGRTSMSRICCRSMVTRSLRHTSMGSCCRRNRM